jgi:peroxiredoxin
MEGSVTDSVAPRSRPGWVGPLLALAVSSALVVAYWWWRSPAATQVKVGDPAPELQLDTLGGGPTRLSSFRGSPVLLVMFLSGCKSCEADAPEIERLHRAYFRKGLIVVGVSVDPDRAALEDFVARHSISYWVMEDFGGAAVREAWGSWQMPEAYLIGADGIVRRVWLGAVDWLAPAVRHEIEALLPEKPPIER